MRGCPVIRLRPVRCLTEVSQLSPRVSWRRPTAKKVAQFSVDDVCQWVMSLSFDPLPFKENAVEGADLLEVCAGSLPPQQDSGGLTHYLHITPPNDVGLRYAYSSPMRNFRTSSSSSRCRSRRSDGN